VEFWQVQSRRYPRTKTDTNKPTRLHDSAADDGIRVIGKGPLTRVFSQCSGPVETHPVPDVRLDVVKASQLIYY
jgi:hypothetical protein